MMHGISSGDLKMKLSETPFLSKEALLARITPSSLDFTKWKKRGEVIVRAQDDSVLLRQDERIVELELVPESGPLENYASSAETLWELASLKPNAAYLRFVLAQHVIDNFNISFMVDTRTAESMQLMGVVGSSDVQDAINFTSCIFYEFINTESFYLPMPCYAELFFYEVFYWKSMTIPAPISGNMKTLHSLIPTYYVFGCTT